MSLVIAPLIIAGYFMGLPYGPKGVAFAYSTVMLLWVIPLIAWSVHDTPISMKDVLIAVSRPLVSSTAAAIIAFGVASLCGGSHWQRLIVGGIVLGGVYLGMLFYVMGQRSFYVDLLLKMIRRAPAEEEVAVSA